MKRRFKFSITDMLIAVAIIGVFLIANVIRRDVGSGVQIILQGWPFPAATTHSLHGLSIYWLGMFANLVIGVCLSGFGAIIACKLRRLVLQKNCDSETNSQNGLTKM